MAEGVDGKAVSAVADALIAVGVVWLVGQRVGPVAPDGGPALDADASLDNQPSAVFDGAVVPGGAAAAERLRADGRALEFLRDAFRHGKTLMGMDDGKQLFAAAGIQPDEADGGLLLVDGMPDDAAPLFLEALARHRHPERETSPPGV